VTEFLVKHTGAVKRLYSERKAREEEQAVPGHVSNGGEQHGEEGMNGEDIEQKEIESEDSLEDAGQALSIEEFKSRLKEAFAEEKSEKEVWKDVIEKICAFGPRRVGPNLLIDGTDEGICGKL
jgi:ribosome assembly protein 1